MEDTKLDHVKLFSPLKTENNSCENTENVSKYRSIEKSV